MIHVRNEDLFSSKYKIRISKDMRGNEKLDNINGKQVVSKLPSIMRTIFKLN